MGPSTNLFPEGTHRTQGVTCTPRPRSTKGRLSLSAIMTALVGITLQQQLRQRQEKAHRKEQEHSELQKEAKEVEARNLAP